MNQVTNLEKHYKTLEERADMNENKLLNSEHLTADEIVNLHKAQREIGVAMQWVGAILKVKCPPKIISPNGNGSLNGNNLKAR